jgi:hypothetical protein
LLKYHFKKAYGGRRGRAGSEVAFVPKQHVMKEYRGSGGETESEVASVPK